MRQFLEKGTHDKLFIKIQNSLDLSTVYRIQLLELPPTQLTIPDRLVYPICVTVNSQMLSRCLRDMGKPCLLPACLPRDLTLPGKNMSPPATFGSRPRGTPSP